jgi:sugar phosphate isomerase/epimerase
MRTAINLYSVRDLDESVLEKLDRVADAGYDGVQFSGGFDATAEEVAERLSETGLDPTPSHVGIDQLENDLEASLDVERTLGTNGVVVPYLAASQFETREAALETADRLDGLASELAARDFGLHYHNHAHEFVAFDGENGFEAFADNCGVSLEVDVGWVLTAGHDPAALIERYADRVDVVHMKDMEPSEGDREFREIGEGEVDMHACADAADEAGAEWLVYEHDQPEDPVASIDAGAAFLNDLV